MNPDLITELNIRDASDGIEQQVVGAVVLQAGTVLLLRRRSDDFRGGTWELPSGKVEPGESVAAALDREVLEETGLEVTECREYLGSFDYHSSSGRASRQHTFLVSVGAGDVTLTEHDRFVWSSPSADESVSDEVRALLRHPTVASET